MTIIFCVMKLFCNYLSVLNVMMSTTQSQQCLILLILKYALMERDGEERPITENAGKIVGVIYCAVNPSHVINKISSMRLGYFCSQ